MSGSAGMQPWHQCSSSVDQLSNAAKQKKTAINTHVHDQARHRVHDRGVSRNTARRIDDTEHALLAVSGDTAVEECRVSVVDDLLEDEGRVLDTRGEGSIVGLVAKLELGALRDGVRAGHPDELDGVTDGRVHREGNVAENTLGRRDDDGVRGTRAGRTRGTRVAGVGARGGTGD